jgi:Mn2+/Fe2+ NRAMP family transporter
MKEPKSFSSRMARFWKLLGPGLVTGASDDDPSGIATYSQAGAAFGLSTLWTSILAFPLMAAIQQMCARIGLVTQQGLTGTLKKHYPRPILYLMLLFSFPAIVMNIGADIAGMGAVGNLLFPAISSMYFSVLFTVLLLGIRPDYLFALSGNRIHPKIFVYCHAGVFCGSFFISSGFWQNHSVDLDPAHRIYQRVHGHFGGDFRDDDFTLFVFLAGFRGSGRDET